MPLQRDWDKAVARYKKDGGTKVISPAFWAACGAVDAASSSFKKCKPASTAGQKALKQFEKSVGKLDSKLGSLERAINPTYGKPSYRLFESAC